MKTKLLLFLLIIIITKTNAQQLIYDFSSGGAGNFVKFNDKFFFENDSKDYGREIWISDGTPGNAKLLKDINVGTGSSVRGGLISNLPILNDKLYFLASDVDSEGEIWMTDGTESGTSKVTNFLNGRVSKLTAIGNFIYFVVRVDEYKIQVWRTDGTSNGAVLVKDGLAIWNQVTYEGKCNNAFIFTFQPYGTNDSRVWRSDGTSAGTYPITEAIDGNGSGIGGTSTLTQYIEHNNKLYFVSRYFLYQTDGTLENTKNVGSLWNAQQNLVQYSDVIEVNNKLYFAFFSANLYKLSIYKFDPSNGNASEIHTNFGLKYFSPSNFLNIDNTLLFSESNQAGGTSLVSLDLNTQQTSDLKELSPSTVELKPYGAFYADIDLSTINKINTDEYFISSADQNFQRKGWILNNKLKTIENIPILDNIWNRDIFVFNDYLYYSIDNKFWKYAKNLNIEDVVKKSSIKIFPNPSSDFMQLNLEDSKEVEGINIFDLNGKLVLSMPNYDSNRIDISKLNQGIYNIQIKLNGKLINKKIIKK